MDKGKPSKKLVGGSSEREYKLTVSLDKNLFNYLGFLEDSRRIGSREEAVLAAIRIFKKLNMQDWFPCVYRMGQERVMIMTQSMMNDLFSTMSDPKLYRVAGIMARNRRALDVFDHELDLSIQDNWSVILNELENYGWGKFTLRSDEIEVEHLAVPLTFMRGYLETLFSVKLAARLGEENRVTLTFTE